MKRLLCLLCYSLALIVAYAQTEEPTTLSHIVRRGESLALLAERFGVTPNHLSALNDDATDFYAGMRVTLPFPHELMGKSDGRQPLDDDILSELYRYRDLCTQADSFFVHSEFNNAHARYDEAIQGFDGYFDCSGAKYARAVCSYHAKNWETARREFDRVIDGGACSEQVLAVAKAYREVCSQREEEILERKWAAEEERRERRRERWRNFGADLVQVAGAVAQAYVQTKYANSSSGYASSGNLIAGLDPESPSYASAVAARSSALNAPIPEAFNPARVAAMVQPVYSFDAKGNMMVSYPGFSQAEAEMNVAVQHSLGSSNPALSASLNRMSALSQQFWNTPMYPEAWVSSSSSFSSSSASSATTDYSASTSALGSSTTNTNMGKRCRKLSTHDIAHCGGSGVCARCNGNKRYFDDSPYVNHWVDCNNCGKTGKCPSCGGNGYRP